MMKKQYSHLVLFLSLCTLTACNDSKNEDSIDPDPLPPSITYHVEGYAELGAFDPTSYRAGQGIKLLYWFISNLRHAGSSAGND